MKLLKKFLRSVKSKGGYTLIEVAAVVAITATLGAVVVPISLDKVNEGKKVAANDNTKAIGGAITAFYKDTGNFPAANGGAAIAGSGTVYYEVLRSGGEVTALFTDGNHDPILAVTNGVWTGDIDVLDNHLTLDNPGGTVDAASPNTDYVDKFKFVNWKGPYSEPFKNADPWGHNYLVYVKAMHTATSDKDGSKQYGWIISAGPNGKLETGVEDSKLVNDDIGYALFSAESGH